MQRLSRVLIVLGAVFVGFICSSMVLAGCSRDEELDLARQGYSNKQIDQECQKFPKFTRDGKRMLFNEDKEYVGSDWPMCKYKTWGEEFDSCVGEERERRASVAAERKAYWASIQAARDAEIQACREGGGIWEASRCMTVAEYAAGLRERDRAWEKKQKNDKREEERKKYGPLGNNGK